MAPRSRMRAHVRVLAAGGAVVLSLLLALPASAKEKGMGLDEDDQIVLTGRLIITSDDTVDDALIFNGPAIVDGTIRNDLTVFNGDTEISGTVRGDVVVFNGDVTVRSGARIGGDLVTQASPTVEEGATIRGDQRGIQTRFDEGFGIAGRFAWWVAYSISVLVLGLVLLLFAPRLGEAVARAVRERTGASIGWGFGLFFLIPIAAVLLLLTLVGIPLGLSLLFALAFIYTVGYAIAPLGVGSLIVRSPQSSRFVIYLVGWAILRALALIPIVGGLLWFAGSVWGLGLLAVAIRSEHRTEPTAAAVPPPPPPMPATTG
jgi:hypothetical protein